MSPSVEPWSATTSQIALEHAQATKARASERDEKAVAGQFESMLLEHLMRGMRTNFGGRPDFGRQTFEQMFDSEIAKAVADQGIGVGSTLFATESASRPQELAHQVDSQGRNPG